MDRKGKGVEVVDGSGASAAPSLASSINGGHSRSKPTFTCASCLRVRLLPDGISEASISRCCDVPDAQVVSVCGGARIASQLLQAGIATLEGLAAIDVGEKDGSELSRVASMARVNSDALMEWVMQARGRELDEVMHELLAPPDPGGRSWDVKVVFARLEEQAGVSTPADLANAPIETTLLPVLHGLNLTERDLVFMRAKAEARLVDAPPWMTQAKSTFPTFGSGYGDGEEGDKVSGEGVRDDTVDVELLRVALQTMREHPDITQAGESVRYLYRISCNIADQPDEVRYRRLRIDNRAYVAHVCGVKGASLAMEALGWCESPDGATCVLHGSKHIGSTTMDVILECMKGLIARAALNTVAAAS